METASPQNLIAARMAERGLEPADVRDRLASAGVSVTYQTAWNWKAGTSRPSNKALLALRSILGLSDSEVLEIAGLASPDATAA